MQVRCLCSELEYCDPIRCKAIVYSIPTYKKALGAKLSRVLRVTT